jgi:hypothetical protein
MESSQEQTNPDQNKPPSHQNNDVTPAKEAQKAKEARR